jgi:uncharacterized membrane protein YfcA
MNLFLIVFFITLLCSLTQTITGFGFAIVMMALMPLFAPDTVAVLLSLLGASAINIWLLWKYRKSVRIRLVFLPALFAALGAVAGVLFGLKTAPALYMRLLGILLFVLSLWFMFFAKRVKIKASPLSGSVAGIVSGVLGAMFAIAGPPLVLYYNAVTEDKEIYMAALQASFLAMSAVSILGRVSVGLWPPDMTAYLPPCALGIVCGVLPGQLVFHKVNAERLKQVVYLFMCVSGIYFAVAA